MITGQGPINENNEKDFKVGSSTFSDDLWNFSEILADEFEHLKPGKLKLNFSDFKDHPRIQKVIKHYILTELTLNTFNSVKRKLSAFSRLPIFLQQNEHITSFEDFTKTEYVSYLNFVVGSELSGVSKKKNGQVMKELLLRGSTRGWDSIKETAGYELIYDELIINNKDIKNDTKFGKTNKVLPPNSEINTLLQAAEKNVSDVFEKLDNNEVISYTYRLKDVTRFFAATSVILMTQLGIRISECITVKAGCLKVIGGEYQITYTTTKTKKTKVEVERPANEVVVKAIQQLEKYSKPLRERSGMPYLFLYVSAYKDLTDNSYRVLLADHGNWNRTFLNPFVEENNLIDSNGKPLKLTSHYFRHIFATYALKDGMKLHDVAEMLNHESIMMTETYDHTKGQKQKVIENILTGETPISSTNKIVLESIEGDQNPFKGKTVEQIDKMRRALKIELLPHGLCLHHPMRGEPCAQDGVCLGCSEFIASADHLPVYEKRLEKVKTELANSPADSVYTTKLYYQQGKLVKYITDLQLKVALKEGSNND
jgi:integrase